MFKDFLKQNKFWVECGDLLPNSMIIFHQNGKILMKNTVFKNLTAPCIHKNFFSFFEKKELEVFQENLAQALALKKPFEKKITITLRKHQFFHFNCLLFPLEDESFCCLLIDSTSLYQKKEMLKNIVDTLPDPVFVKDQQHQFQYVNPAFANALGYRVEEVLHKTDVDFFPENEREIFYKLDRKVFKSGKMTVNKENFTGIHGTRMISTKKAIFKTLAGQKILVGIIQDITDIEKAKNILRNNASTLKRQVNMRTKQLEQKKNQLEKTVKNLKRLNNELDYFAHICCHELRQPLRIISSFSELVLKNLIMKDENHQSVDLLQTVMKEINHMQNLMDTILSQSRGKEVVDTKTTFSAQVLLDEVLSTLDSKIQDKNAIIKVDSLPTIHADRMQMMQLFQNLLSNSITFCSASKTPIVRIFAKKTINHVEFKVVDNGLGIPKCYHKELFLPFKKFHSAIEGSTNGLGLHVCKKIVENHDGVIQAYSQEKIGTMFKIRLPQDNLKT